MGDRLIDESTVAEAFGIHRATLWRWVDKKLIPRPVVTQHKFTRWSEQQVQDRIEELKKSQQQEAAS